MSGGSWARRANKRGYYVTRLIDRLGIVFYPGGGGGGTGSATSNFVSRSRPQEANRSKPAELINSALNSIRSYMNPLATGRPCCLGRLAEKNNARWRC